MTQSKRLGGWQQSFLPEVEWYWLENSHLTDPAIQAVPRRQAPTGWIEERLSNLKRQHPTVCYYFCWYEGHAGASRKHKTYVPQAQMSAVWQSCKVEKQPYTATLQLIQKAGKAHSTEAKDGKTMAPSSPVKQTVRFTVDLPLSLHRRLSDLAAQHGTRKATLVRMAIAQLSAEDVVAELPLVEATKRFTLDMDVTQHKAFSILAITLGHSKADLVRWALGRLLQQGN